MVFVTKLGRLTCPNMNQELAITPDATGSWAVIPEAKDLDQAKLDAITDRLPGVGGSRSAKRVQLLQDEILLVIERAKAASVSQPILPKLQVPLSVRYLRREELGCWRSRYLTNPSC